MVVLCLLFHSGILLDMSVDLIDGETFIRPIFNSIFPVTVCWKKQN